MQVIKKNPSDKCKLYILQNIHIIAMAETLYSTNKHDVVDVQQMVKLQNEWVDIAYVVADL